MKGEQVFRISAQDMGSARKDAAHLGFKALGLARMARRGLPVPPAFVLGTAHCRRAFQKPEGFRRRLRSLLEGPMQWLESVTSRGFGDPRKPLLISVRSGAPVSMPGMLDTLLNVGLCDATVRGLLRMTGNPRLVWDSYRRLVQNFAEVVGGADPQPFGAAIGEALARENVDRVQNLDHLSLAQLLQTNLNLFAEAAGKPFPQDPYEQLEQAILAVIASWNSPRAVAYRRLNGIADDLGTAVTVQQMVFGNAGGTSGAGVGFTRDPDTGEKRLFFEFLFNSQGEDVVSGRSAGSDAERIFLTLPETEKQLLDLSAALEMEYGDAQEFEFTLHEGALYLLQTRTAKRTPWASLRMAVEQAEEGLITRQEALARVAELALGEIRRKRLAAGDLQPLGQGQSAGVGVAAGPIAFDGEAAGRFAAEGRPAILVREEMTTADIAALALSGGVLTRLGNRTSHAAVVARQMDKACIIAGSLLSIDPRRHHLTIGGHTLAEGETLTLDSNCGGIFSGAVEIVAERPDIWLAKIDQWQQLAPEPE